ncbi:unnamed protein product [Boreogadus saida]
MKSSIRMVHRIPCGNQNMATTAVTATQPPPPLLLVAVIQLLPSPHSGLISRHCRRWSRWLVSTILRGRWRCPGGRQDVPGRWSTLCPPGTEIQAPDAANATDHGEALEA